MQVAATLDSELLEVLSPPVITDYINEIREKYAGQLEETNRLLLTTFAQLSATTEVRQNKVDYAYQLEAFIERNLIDGELRIVGSTATETDNTGSDLDAVFIPEVQIACANEEEGKRFATKQFLALRQLLMGRYARALKVTNPRVIKGRIPLLEFSNGTFDTQIQFGSEQTTAVRNTALIKTIVDLDPRIRQIIILVKDILQRHRQVGSRHHNWNSLATVLLIVFYLQHVEPPILPPLSALSTWDRPGGENELTLAELLVGYFKFFKRLPLRTHSIDTATARMKPKIDDSVPVQVWDPTDDRNEDNAARSVSADCRDETRRMFAAMSNDVRKWGLKKLLEVAVSRADAAREQ